jgi:hypothetical protein
MTTVSPLPISSSYGEHTNWQKYAFLNSPGQRSLIDHADPPKAKGRRRRKSSSTNHLFLDSILSAPDTKEIVKAIAHTIHCATVKGTKNPSSINDEIWSEEYQPLDANRLVWVVAPSEKSVESFLLHMFKNTVMSSECCVMAMVYMDRLIELTGVVVQPKNWRRLLLGAQIVANKVWNDDAVWIEDFLVPFPTMKISDLGDLERYYLNGLQFSVTLKPSVYAEYYFRLRALSTKSDKIFKPLDEESVQRLYDKSRGLEARTRYAAGSTPTRRRSLSCDPFAPVIVPLSTEQIHFPKEDSDEEDSRGRRASISY